MKLTEFSHRSGNAVLGSAILERTRKSLSNIAFHARKGSASTVRDAILGELQAIGWSDKVQISPRRKITITAMQKKIGLCLQTGNMARFYADLLKLQSLFLEETIYGAIYILPKHDAANKMGQNLVNYERLTCELSEEFLRVITIPMQVIGFDEGE